MTSVDHGLLGGRYELQELIATGGMGEVWRGRDVRFDRPVAVKVLRSEYADDPSFAARFRAEATHAASLSHPNIAAVHDYGETDTEATGEHIAYLVMELVDGEPLSALFRDGGPLDTETALSLLRQAAAGLAEAHRAGLVHRDVKPANILIDRAGRVKLTDFGIAWSAASVPLTKTGQVIGTPQYMSPEQASGEPPRPASDVYSLGLIGYESLTGHAAFDGDNPVTIALKQVQQEPEPLPEDVPDDVRHLIDAALTKDPDARIPDADAFLSAIDATLDGSGSEDQGTRALPVAATPATTPVAALRAGARSARRRPAVRSRRSWRLLVPLLAVLLGGGAVATGAALSSGEAGSTGAAAAATPDRGAIVLTAADHVGRPADEVADDLTELGLRVERLDRETGDQPPGTVAALDPVESPLSAGDTVRLFVAVAPPEAADGGTAAGTTAATGGSRATAPADGTGTPGPASGQVAPPPAPAPESPAGAADPGAGAADPGAGAGPGTGPGATEPTTPTGPGGPSAGGDEGTDEGNGDGSGEGTTPPTGTDDGTTTSPPPEEGSATGEEGTTEGGTDPATTSTASTSPAA